MLDRVCFLHFQCDKQTYVLCCLLHHFMEFWGLNVSGKNQNILKKSGSLLKVRFFSEHPINFMAKITNPCPGFCLPAVNSCGSQSWQAIRRSREGRCWALLTHIQQQQLHMFEIMSWSFRFEFYCLF